MTGDALRGKILNATEVLNVLQNTVDTIWLITPKDGRVEILRDEMIPDFVGKKWDIKELDAVYVREYVYPTDVSKWEEQLAIPVLLQLEEAECKEKTFDMRFRSVTGLFEWRQIFLKVLKDENGNPDGILLTSRYINDSKKADIVMKAVESEYDYVVYIEPEHNSYVMYASNHETGTPVPPVASDNYELEVEKFHLTYVPEDERDRLTRQLRIAHVQPILQKMGEYAVCGKVIENGACRDKKLRFSYFDKDRNIWLLTRTDITEIVEVNRQKQLLQDALNEATAANMAKSEFLSRMSHDIRTPMNAIIGMTAIAGAHIGEQERVADCLRKITVSSKLLLSLINEVLDMAKVESGNIVLAEEKIDLAALVQDVVTMIQPMIDKKKQYFAAHIKNVKNERLMGDIGRLQQLLLNLLSNANKYTQEAGHICLEVRERPSIQRGMGCFEFSVDDDGIGMKPEFLEKIFEPFERADDDAIKMIPGTGLGMAISRKIVDMMGGNIKIESDYGHGSSFTVTVFLRLREQAEPDTNLPAGLPILIVDDDEMICLDVCERLNQMGMNSEYTLCGSEAVQRVEDAHRRGCDYFAIIIDLRMPQMDGIETTRQIRTKVGNEVPIIMISSYDWSNYEQKAIAAGVNSFIVKPLFQSSLVSKLKQFISREKTIIPRGYDDVLKGEYEGKRVLLVEDNEINCEIGVELLTSMKLKVETARNGKEAVDMVMAHSGSYYDLIFMDMQMPVLDGCEATEMIRKQERGSTKRIPIVAMTANAFADDVQKTKQAGMDGHLSKPIDMEVLSQTLAKWLV